MKKKFFSAVIVLLTLATIACLATVQAAPKPSPTPTPSKDGDLGNGNTSEGTGALFSLTTGAYNTAMGSDALFSNTTGSANTAVGFQALYSNTTEGLDVNQTTVPDWQGNTATGYQALYSNTTGSGNVANGMWALTNNTTGIINTATGRIALTSNTTGSRNTGDGDAALASNTKGFLNTATGWAALGNNTIGTGNIALGPGAGHNLDTGDNNIDIGNDGNPGESNTIRIGNPVASVYNDIPNPDGRTTRTVHPPNTTTFIAGIRGATTVNADALPVVIDSAGQLGTLSSSERFKSEIKPMDRSSEGILALKPVTFHYKNDSKGIPQFGLIAEEVAKMNPDLVVRDRNGQIYTVRYDAVNAMLLNEFLKEHSRVQELEKQVEKLTAGLQKVSNELELRKPAPRTVDNNQ